jgi:hypothetical protein
MTAPKDSGTVHYLYARLREIRNELGRITYEKNSLRFVRNKLSADIEALTEQAIALARDQDGIEADLLDMERAVNPLCAIEGHDWPRLTGPPGYVVARVTVTCGRCGAQRIPTENSVEGWRYVYPRPTDEETQT